MLGVTVFPKYLWSCITFVEVFVEVLHGTIISGSPLTVKHDSQQPRAIQLSLLWCNTGCFDIYSKYNGVNKCKYKYKHKYKHKQSNTTAKGNPALTPLTQHWLIWHLLQIQWGKMYKYKYKYRCKHKHTNTRAKEIQHSFLLYNLTTDYFRNFLQIQI